MTSQNEKELVERLQKQDRIIQLKNLIEVSEFELSLLEKNKPDDEVKKLVNYYRNSLKSKSFTDKIIDYERIKNEKEKLIRKYFHMR